MTPLPRDRPDNLSEPPPVRWWKRLLRITAAVAIVGVGIAGATYLQKSAARPQKRAPAKWVPVVETQPLQHTSHGVTVSAMGTVIPAQTVLLKSRVSGQVVAINPEFTDGGFLKQGSVVVQLDDSDYKLALAQKKSELVNAQYALKLELGRQTVAQREWQLLYGNRGKEAVDSDLALRKPHLDKAKADVDAAKAAVEKAALDLDRTRIIAPFNAIVRSKSVDVGSQVSAGESMAEMVGTDAFWIQASIPVDRIEWIRIPQQNKETGSAAKVYYAGGHTAKGTVNRLMGDLDSEGRMARILIEVKDPMQRQANARLAPPLLIGEYVRVEVEGRQLDDVFVIPRTALRDGSTVWIMNDDMTLSIQKVEPLWRSDLAVVIQNDLQLGQQLIVSDLPAPVDGMAIRHKPKPEQATATKTTEDPNAQGSGNGK
jgi:RND family efflux transporter MFP subunit